jgi:hypothetical protein
MPALCRSPHILETPHRNVTQRALSRFIGALRARGVMEKDSEPVNKHHVRSTVRAYRAYRIKRKANRGLTRLSVYKTSAITLSMLLH